MIVADYPNPSMLMVDVRPPISLQSINHADAPKSAILVTTKNRPDRLMSTLPRLAGSSLGVVVIDDSSTSRAAASTNRICRKVGVTYHGRKEQELALKPVPPHLLDGLIAPLGASGWTLGMCRNYSLLLSRILGFERIILIDDDISIPNDDFPARTVSLLKGFDFAGARTVGLPDDSVVGHIARRHGVVQYDFVTGQYLGVRTRVQPAFFPNEYNEDLIFLMLAAGKGKVARYGTVRQLKRGSSRYSLEKATSQERGEIHSEGCMRAVISGQTESLTDTSYWENILNIRMQGLQDLLAREREWGGEHLDTLKGVVQVSKRFLPKDFSSFYRVYFDAVPRWVNLQEIIS